MIRLNQSLVLQLLVASVILPLSHAQQPATEAGNDSQSLITYDIPIPEKMSLDAGIEDEFAARAEFDLENETAALERSLALDAEREASTPTGWGEFNTTGETVDEFGSKFIYKTFRSPNAPNLKVGIHIQPKVPSDQVTRKGYVHPTIEIIQQSLSGRVFTVFFKIHDHDATLQDVVNSNPEYASVQLERAELLNVRVSTQLFRSQLVQVFPSFPSEGDFYVQFLLSPEQAEIIRDFGRYVVMNVESDLKLEKASYEILDIDERLIQQQTHTSTIRSHSESGGAGFTAFYNGFRANAAANINERILEAVESSTQSSDRRTRVLRIRRGFNESAAPLSEDLIGRLIDEVWNLGEGVNPNFGTITITDDGTEPPEPVEGPDLSGVNVRYTSENGTQTVRSFSYASLSRRLTSVDINFSVEAAPVSTIPQHPIVRVERIPVQFVMQGHEGAVVRTASNRFQVDGLPGAQTPTIRGQFGMSMVNFRASNIRPSYEVHVGPETNCLRSCGGRCCKHVYTTVSYENQNRNIVSDATELVRGDVYVGGQNTGTIPHDRITEVEIDQEFEIRVSDLRPSPSDPKYSGMILAVDGYYGFDSNGNANSPVTPGGGGIQLKEGHQHRSVRYPNKITVRGQVVLFQKVEPEFVLD